MLSPLLVYLTAILPELHRRLWLQPTPWPLWISAFTALAIPQRSAPDDHKTHVTPNARQPTAYMDHVTLAARQPLASAVLTTR